MQPQKERLRLKRQDNGDWPDAAQVFVRAREYPDFFEIMGNAEECTIRLRKIGDAPPLRS